MSATPLAIEVPRVPVGDTIEQFFDWLTTALDAFFDVVSDGLGSLVDGLIALLQAPDPVVLAVIFALFGLLLGGWRLGLVSLVGLMLVISMEQWDAAMQTLALVLVSALGALIVAIPLGIWAASSRRVSAVLRPVMDLMQTMPAFVWLVPVVTLFSIGVVPGVIATIIFALPPGVRLTELGIRNVDHEVVEASHAFGFTPRQTLFGVQLPLALPTIMAGVNQVIMLALSMAVIAGLVGAEGLGGAVTAAIATLNLGLGFEAGLSVVVLAIYLDRVTASIGHGKGGSLLRKLRRGRRPAAVEDPVDDATRDEPAIPDELPTKIGA
ncbi:glycine betaine/proline transport system permease protein [Geodermatophilus telluris]|uniref:Glycine betaine/proline transport system permease protein n=1 Tax=Geodermatophilus telluris TaxID=1190417 RepID=A0A1G6QLM5_9ACTN|nr:proline/glycine betaine ABC transporter permease [Geodermatophilus telluris]SDC92924.1 glycine betaine/proline transport system permease protein [Geodermatophilus telluris]